MRIEIGKDENDWVDRIWTWVHSQVKSQARVFVPAGGTPTPLYRQWVKKPSEHLKSLRLIQIDDILTGPQRGTFKQFFAAEMAPYLDQFEWIDRADRTADVAILGVGVNGHVAFHEPGFPRQFYSGCVPLSSETKSYLNLTEPTWGITYGAASFLQCQKILVLARGERKKKIMQQAALDKSLPIGWIMEHRDVTLISDFDF
jgi:6-phosphogluconolactonase/glucosamine-6-phosphate isomerase/deaminase